MRHQKPQEFSLNTHRCLSRLLTNLKKGSLKLMKSPPVVAFFFIVQGEMVSSEEKYPNLWSEYSSAVTLTAPVYACPPQRLDNDMLAAQIAGLPSAWNCKHSGGTLVRTFQKNPQLGILGSALRVCILPLGHQREQGVLWSVCSKSYIRKNVSQQMLSIPLQTVNWKMVEGLLPTICPILSPSFSYRNGKLAVVVTPATTQIVSIE